MEQNKSFFKVHSVTLSNKETIAYRKQTSPSSQQTIIFLHGQTSTSIIYEDIFLHFQKESLFDLYALDMRGFGDSSLITPLSSFKDIAYDILLFIQNLKLKNVSLAGISTGGAVSMIFAAEYPTVLRTVVLIDSVGAKGLHFYKDPKSKELITSFEDLKKGEMLKIKEAVDKKNLIFLGSQFKKTCYNVGKAPPPAKGAKTIMEVFKQRHVLEICWLLHNFNISDENNGVCMGTGEYKKIQCPVLIIHGDKDILVPLKEAEFTYKILGEKIARLEVLKECGHVPTYSESEKTANLIKNFIVEKCTQAKL